MKKLKKEEEGYMQTLNAYIKGVTGIDFVDKMEELAIYEKVSELEVRDFFRKNYPGADRPEELSRGDKQTLSLFLRYYCQKVKEHSCAYEKADATKLAHPNPRPDLNYYDSLFDSLVSGSKFSYDLVGT